MLSHALRKPGFSLIEALVALSVTTMAGAVLLLAVESSLQNSVEAVDRTIADGIAQQLLDEILTKRFVEVGEGNVAGVPVGPLGPLAGELLGNGRQLFNDIDDYAGYIVQPITGPRGQTLGVGDDTGNQRLAQFRAPTNFFQNWRARVDVYCVDPNDHRIRSSASTAYRAIEVFVEVVDGDGAVHPLAHRKRIVTYLPPPPT